MMHGCTLRFCKPLILCFMVLGLAKPSNTGLKPDMAAQEGSITSTECESASTVIDTLSIDDSSINRMQAFVRGRVCKYRSGFKVELLKEEEGNEKLSGYFSVLDPVPYEVEEKDMKFAEKKVQRDRWYNNLLEFELVMEAFYIRVVSESPLLSGDQKSEATKLWGKIPKVQFGNNLPSEIDIWKPSRSATHTEFLMIHDILKEKLDITTILSTFKDEINTLKNMSGKLDKLQPKKDSIACNVEKANKDTFSKALTLLKEKPALLPDTIYSVKAMCPVCEIFLTSLYELCGKDAKFISRKNTYNSPNSNKSTHLKKVFLDDLDTSTKVKKTSNPGPRSGRTQIGSGRYNLADITHCNTHYIQQIPHPPSTPNGGWGTGTWQSELPKCPWLDAAKKGAEQTQSTSKVGDGGIRGGYECPGADKKSTGHGGDGGVQQQPPAPNGGGVWARRDSKGLGSPTKQSETDDYASLFPKLASLSSTDQERNTKGSGTAFKSPSG